MRQSEVGPPRAPRWGLGDAVLGMFVGLMLSSVVASIWLGATHRKQLTLGGLALSQLGLWVGLVAAPVLATRIKGSRSLAGDFGFCGLPSDVPLGVLAGVLAQVVLLPLIALALHPLVGKPDVSRPVRNLVSDAKGPALVGLILFVVVGAPLVEELFFRGLLLRSLQRRVGTVGAVAISAVLFGLAHAQSLPAGGLLLVIVSLTGLGAVLGALAVRTGRLGAGVVAHATFNAFSVVVVLTR